MALAASVAMTFASEAIGLFSKNSDVIMIGTAYLRIVSPVYVFAALGIVLSRSLIGAGDTIGPMVITFIALWALQVPLAVTLSRFWEPPTSGIWWSIVIAMSVQGLMAAGWFSTGRWKHKRV